MSYLIPALLATVVGFSAAHAAPAKSPFSNKSFGDGGGYKHPDASVGGFFEAAPERPAEPKPQRPKLPPKAEPKTGTVEAAPSRPRPRPFPAPAMADAPVKTAAAEAAPSSVPAPAPDAGGAALDSASEDARRDYESRLLGIAPEPRRPGLADAGSAFARETAAEAAPGEGVLFVSLELDPREAGALRDAVAGLGAAAAFRPDARFQPLPGEGGKVRISGWLPASRLGDAIARPGVKRVAVERGSRPAADSRLAGDFLVRLRVRDASRTEESIAESVRELTAQSGFAMGRVLGVETAAGGGAAAIVSGTIPLSRLSRALGLPGVLAVDSASPARAEAPPAEHSKKEGFLSFVMARGLWLVLLTVLLALPVMGKAVRNGLAVFVPYR